MKVKILQEDLQKGFNLSQRFVASRPQLPILANFLIETDKGKLKLSATDLSLGLSVWIDAKVEEEGKTSVPAKEITEFISYLSPGEVELATNKQILKVLSARAEADFAGVKADEFPQSPAIEDGLLTLPAAELTAAVNQVSFAAASDESRPVLEGILWLLAAKEYQLVATDGYRLAHKKVGLKQGVGKPTSFLVPARSFNEVAKLAHSFSDLKVGWNKQKNQISFLLPNLKLTSRLLGGEFPEYQKIIPQAAKILAFVDSQELLAAIRAVSVFARQAGNVIVLNFQPDQLDIQASAPQVGRNKATVPIRLEGNKITVAFNYRFLLDFLNNLPNNESEVAIRMNDALSPVVFTLKGDDSLLHLIMPVRLDH